MSGAMLAIHAMERYRDLLREAELERRSREAGPAQAMGFLRGLGSALMAVIR